MIGRFDIYRGGRDLNTSGPGAVERGTERSGLISKHLRVVSAAPHAPESGSARSTCSTVVSEQDRRHEVAEALRKAMIDWSTSGDRSSLRRQLLALLMLVETVG